MSERDYIGRRVGESTSPEAEETPQGPPNRRRRRAKPWPLAKVFAKSPTALAVWFALLEDAEARRSTVVTPTRDELALAVGTKRLKTISMTLTLLERAGWISRSHVPVSRGGQRTATLLRIAICRRGRWTAPYGTRRRKGRYTAPKVKGAPPPQDSLTERGRVPTAALSGRRHPPFRQRPPSKIAHQRLSTCARICLLPQRRWRTGVLIRHAESGEIALSSSAT